MIHTYTIDKSNNSINIFVAGQKTPVLFQAKYPNGESFDSPLEAEEWAQLFIASIIDENAPFAPIGKGISGEPRPTDAEILVHLKSRAQEYGENIPEQLARRISDLEAKLA